MSWNAALGEISNQLSQYDITKAITPEAAKSVVQDLWKISQKILEIFAEFGRKEINPGANLLTNSLQSKVLSLMNHYITIAKPAAKAAMEASIIYTPRLC